MSVAPQFFIPAVALKLNTTYFAEHRIANPAAHILQLANTVKVNINPDDYSLSIEPLIKDPEISSFFHDKSQLIEECNFDAWYEFIFEPNSATIGTTRNPRPGEEMLPIKPEILEFADRLRSEPEFLYSETLGPYSVPQVAFPPLNPDDDPDIAKATYLWPAPVGIGAHDGWAWPGGTGEGESVTDIEQGWNFTHEDLSTPVFPPVELYGGINMREFNHGTGVLGVIIARDNTKGSVGIAPHGIAKAVSQYSDSQTVNTPQAIGVAMFYAQPGEVILLELQTWYQVNQMLAPGEWETPTYEAIKCATSAGYHVVEAAGNGAYQDGRSSLDLDTARLNGKLILNRNSPDFRDSGAIMVGAATSTVPHQRLSYSNHGSRIDYYSFGQNIFTTSSEHQSGYRTDFSGTSGASAIIAGAVMQVQGVFRKKSGHSSASLDPLALRNTILRYRGTPSANGAAVDRIGVQPNIPAVIQQYICPEHDSC